MRGDFGEGNPWQSRWARRWSQYCGDVGHCMRIEEPQEVTAVDAALTMVFQGGNAVAVLLTQKLLGAKAF
jgi:hypothetical protein